MAISGQQWERMLEAHEEAYDKMLESLNAFVDAPDLDFPDANETLDLKKQQVVKSYADLYRKMTRFQRTLRHGCDIREGDS